MTFHETSLDQPFLAPLSDIPSAPEQMWRYGELPAERRPVVSIVGSRRCTDYGREVAHRVAYELAQAGVVIVSGLAYGIDAAAHRGCLEAGGTTVAVLGTAIDHIYPASNQALAHEIVQNGGAILSERPPGYQSQRFDFVYRNRIVSGLADALLVAEASQSSGTFHTANYAAEQQKDVFVVPGDLTRPMSAGCNQIAKNGGATVFTGVPDILERLYGKLPKTKARPLPRLSDQERSIVDNLRAGVKEGERLARSAGVDVARFNQLITLLELKDIVRALGCNKWQLAPQYACAKI